MILLFFPSHFTLVRLEFSTMINLNFEIVCRFTEIFFQVDLCIHLTYLSKNLSNVKEILPQRSTA